MMVDLWGFLDDSVDSLSWSPFSIIKPNKYKEQISAFIIQSYALPVVTRAENSTWCFLLLRAARSQG